MQYTPVVKTLYVQGGLGVAVAVRAASSCRVGRAAAGAGCRLGVVQFDGYLSWSRNASNLSTASGRFSRPKPMRKWLPR